METKRIEDFGGSLESKDNTAAFAAAKDFFEKNNGGVLQVAKGVWHTGPIELCSNMTLELEEGAVVQFIPDFTIYRPVKSRWEGVTSYAMHPCVFATGCHDVVIKGKGVFDGSGQVWWKIVPEKKKQGGPILPIEKELASLNPGYESQPGGGGGRNTQFLRPPLMQFYECENVTVSDFTLQNSPFWTFHPVYCKNLTAKGITVKNPADAPNTDGIDIDSCVDVVIDSCAVSVGDDGIAVKSGSGEDGIRVNKPSVNVRVTGCTVQNGHGGLVIGSETAGGIDTVKIDNCFFNKTDRGIRIKTRRGRGGAIKNLFFDNITMEGNLCPITVNMYYRCGADPNDQTLFSTGPMPVGNDTPTIETVHITNVKATGCRSSAGFVVALPESQIKDFVIKNSSFSTDENDKTEPCVSEMYAGIADAPGKSFRVLNADNPVFENVTITGPKEQFFFG